MKKTSSKYDRDLARVIAVFTFLSYTPSNLLFPSHSRYD